MLRGLTQTINIITNATSCAVWFSTILMFSYYKPSIGHWVLVLCFSGHVSPTNLLVGGGLDSVLGGSHLIYLVWKNGSVLFIFGNPPMLIPYNIYQHYLFMFSISPCLLVLNLCISPLRVGFTSLPCPSYTCKNSVLDGR